VHGRLNVNVALNRPTFAISEWYHSIFGTIMWSRKAVDGNNDTDAEKPDSSCFISQWEDNPWMAVDLGAALAVVGVLFTNREGPYGNVLVFTLITDSAAASILDFSSTTGVVNYSNCLC